MIVTWVIQAVAGMMTGVLSILPTWNVDTSAVTGFSGGLGSWLGKLNGYVPESLLLICLGILLLVKIALFVWRGLVFVYSMIPFVS